MGQAELPVTFTTCKWEEIMLIARLKIAFNTIHDQIQKLFRLLYRLLMNIICESSSSDLTKDAYQNSIHIIKDIKWLLRGNIARKNCMTRSLGFPRNANTQVVQIVWSLSQPIRTIQYYKKIYALVVEEALNGYLYNLTFLLPSGSNTLPIELQQAFPNASSKSLLSTSTHICIMLTSDILISTGDALPPLAVLFSSLFQPILVEERRHEASTSNSILRHHYHSGNEAILLEDGVTVLETIEVINLIRSVLSIQKRFNSIYSNNTNSNNIQSNNNNNKIMSYNTLTTPMSIPSLSIPTTLTSNQYWSPYEINHTCPIFIAGKTSNHGLGDELEQYLHILQVSKIFKGTVIVDGFVGDEKLAKPHSGTDVYREAAMMLGVRVDRNESFMMKTFHAPKSAFKSWEYPGVVPPIPCNSHIRVCWTCFGTLCSVRDGYHPFLHVKWLIRDNNACQQCLQQHQQQQLQQYQSLQLQSQHNHHNNNHHKSIKNIFINQNNIKKEIIIVIHIRNGDICVNCNNVQHFKLIITQLKISLQGRLHKIIFESQEPLPLLEKAFPRAIFHANTPLLRTICTFLTADILIATGSSFPAMIAAFGLPLHPIVIEEERKEMQYNSALVSSATRHFYHTDDNAFFMSKGIFQMDLYELRRVFDSVFDAMD
eukprot:gene2684-5279_t